MGPISPSTTTAARRASEAPEQTLGTFRASLSALKLFPIFLIVWLISALWVWNGLDRGWVPHDEGALAQSAERVLYGEIPHRDFDEIYTGGLTYLNAAAFRVFGPHLFSLRLPLFFAFVLWVPVLFYTYSRLVPALGAGLATLLAVAWSLPNYSSPIPSWYNLFLATAGVAALYSYLESKRRHWLFCAGIAAGMSCLFKIVGLYFVAATFLLSRLSSRRPTPLRQQFTGAAYGLTHWLSSLAVHCLYRRSS